MTSISTAGSALMPNMAAGRVAAFNRPGATPVEAPNTASQPSSLLMLTGAAADAVVYAKPKTMGEPLRVPIRAWASPQQDAISALMARNSGKGPGTSLADQWRGLGGALLSRFAATADSDYQQTVADYVVPQTAGAAAAERTQALDAQALNAVQADAATVNLTIQTRSGQTVALKIAVNPGSDDGHSGLQVELASSGPLSSDEREVLAKLADSLDAVLEGLGQQGSPKLDLAQLMDYDSNVLASLDLTVKNPKADQALSSFSLHLGADQKTLALKGSAGDINLNLGKGMPLGPVNALQRRAAIEAHLQKVDAAADRGHANAALLALFKDAFTQLHSSPSNQAAAQAESLSPALARQVQPLQSGLADFDASFSGKSERTNARGAVNETGKTDYALSQKTTVKPAGVAGELSASQTQSEKLAAHYIKSRFGGMLDTSTGDHDVYKIKDENTATTSIEAVRGKLAQASRRTDQHQLKTFDQLVNHRTKAHTSTPLNKSFVEQLI